MKIDVWNRGDVRAINPYRLGQALGAGGGIWPVMTGAFAAPAMLRNAGESAEAWAGTGCVYWQQLSEPDLE